MPIDSNGNYTLPTSSTAVTGELIEASKHNSTCDDFKQAFNLSLWRDGRAPWTGDHNANGNTIGGLKKVVDWTSQQAVGASDVENRYMKSDGATFVDGAATSGSTNTAVKSVQIVNGASGDASNTYLEVGADGQAYAVPTNANVEAQVAAEALRASAIESNLQSQMSGKQPVGTYISGLGAGTHPTTLNMQMVNADNGEDSAAAYLQVLVDVAGVGGKAISIPTSDNVGKQISDYTEDKNYISGTGGGLIVQPFTFQITQDNQRVNFPKAFSGIPLAIVLSETTKDLDLGAGDPTTWDASGFTVTHFGGTLNQIVSVIAIGPGG